MRKHKCGEENHKFEARYDYLSSRGCEWQGGLAEDLARVLEVQKRGNYVYDICVYCGKVVKK